MYATRLYGSRRLFHILIGGALLHLSALGGAEAPDGAVFHGNSAGSAIVVDADAKQVDAPGLKAPTRERLVESTYAEKRIPKSSCGNANGGHGPDLCTADLLAARAHVQCADGEVALEPLYRREVAADGAPVGLWVQVDDGCPGDPQAAVFLSVEDFRRLPLSASVASYQPSTGTGLVNMELIVFTDPAPQVLQTTVLGTPVTVRATPAQFSWDFGDGAEPLVTTDPGAPYPQFRVFHVYREAGSYLVQLTTTWSGEFQVNGRGPWYPVTGAAQTTSQAYPETVVEAKSRLVDGPLP